MQRGVSDAAHTNAVVQHMCQEGRFRHRSVMRGTCPRSMTPGHGTHRSSVYGLPRGYEGAGVTSSLSEQSSSPAASSASRDCPAAAAPQDMKHMHRGRPSCRGVGGQGYWRGGEVERSVQSAGSGCSR
jgi:hypothetical protein